MAYGLTLPVGLSRDDATVLLVESRRKDSERDCGDFLKNLAGWYDDYRGIYRGEVASYRNNLGLPLAYSMVWAATAKQVQALFSTYPYVSFMPHAPEYNAQANKTSLLTSAQLKDARAFEKSVDFHSSAGIYGTAIWRVGWSYIQRLRAVKQTILGQVISRPQPVIEFNGPDLQVVDLLDFRIAPGFKRVQDAPWIMFRYYLDLDDLEEMDGGPFSTLKPGALAALKATGMPSDVRAEFEERQSHSRSVSDYQARRSTSFSKPVEIWEMIGTVPREFAPEGVRERVIAIANGRVVLRNDPSPFWVKPAIAHSPTPDPHSFYGIGKVQAVSKMQMAANRILNQKLDLIDLTISPVFLGDANRMPDTDSLFTEPGKVWLTDGDPSNILQPIIPNLSGLQAAYMELDSLWKYMQMAGAVGEDTVMGMPGGDRQTAFEFRGRQEQAMTRLALEAMLASSALEEVAEQFHYLNRELLPMPTQLRILGSLATTNPTTGLPLPPDTPIIEAGELDHNFRAKCFGPMTMLSRAAQRQDGMQLAQIFSANPVLLQALNWVGFARKMFSLFDGWDSNEMLVQQVPAINQLAMANNMSPEDLVNMSMDPSSAMAAGTPGINGNPNTEAEYAEAGATN